MAKIQNRTTKTQTTILSNSCSSFGIWCILSLMVHINTHSFQSDDLPVSAAQTAMDALLYFIKTLTSLIT